MTAPRERDPACADRGSVTVEAAIALAALMVAVALCLAAIAAMIAQIQVTDAAAEAGRLAARGDSAGAQAAADQLAPPGSSVTLSGVDRVTAEVAAPVWARVLPGIAPVGRAVFAAEPGVYPGQP